MNYKKLIIALIMPQLAGFIGSFFTISAIPTWYASIQKPSFNPPNWIFGPVWTILYILMGISVYLVWNKASKKSTASSVVILFWIHLFFNALWSIIFFGIPSPGGALIVILILWILILALILKFWKISKWASYLLIPYFLWVSFASVLNYYIWYLN